MTQRFRRCTKDNLLDVLARFVAHAVDTVNAGGEPAAALANDFDCFLDEQQGEDAFGTEGQTDPRGDHRD